MENILIASNSNGILTVISDFLQSEQVNRIITTQNGSEARRYITESDFDMVIIDGPLKDEPGTDLAITASEKTSGGIILIVDGVNLQEISAIVEEYGVFVLPKAITPELFYQAAKLLSAARKRVQRLENENLRLQKKIDEIRTVDRAKLILIQVLKMTEPQAQHYIEKQSMDLRQNRLTTAENILRTYEN